MTIMARFTVGTTPRHSRPTPSSAATDGLARVALDTGVPVGFGLLTCDDEAQALDRAGLEGSREDKGREAAEAALATWAVLRSVAER